MSYLDDDNFDSMDIEIPTMDISVEEVMKQCAVKASTETGHLSTATLISLLYDIDPEHVTTMVEIAAKYDMVVSPTLKGWKGIDSKLCIKLLHITCEWNSDRVRLPNRSGPVAMQGRIKPTLQPVDHVILSYYQALWRHYQQCFSGNTCYILTVEKNRSKWRLVQA